MNKKFGIARQLLNICPTCFLNFRKNFCASTCSPVQKKFLKVSENNIIKRKKEPCGDWDTIDTDSDGAEGEMVEMVESVEFHIHRDFMQKIYDSCKDIRMQGGIPVFNGAMCGPWGQHCNPERLFDYIGSGPERRGPAPFSFNYTIWDQPNINQAKANGIEPLNTRIDSCEIGVSGNPGCSCSYCEKACVPPDISEFVEEDFNIVPGVDGVVFIMVIIFVVGTIIFLAIIIASKILKHPSNLGSPSSIPLMEGGAKIHII
jgi:hypothetical protein